MNGQLHHVHCRSFFVCTVQNAVLRGNFLRPRVIPKGGGIAHNGHFLHPLLKVHDPARIFRRSGIIPRGLLEHVVQPEIVLIDYGCVPKDIPRSGNLHKPGGENTAVEWNLVCVVNMEIAEDIRAGVLPEKVLDFFQRRHIPLLLLI